MSYIWENKMGLERSPRSRLGPYTLGERLGVGGMAEVYLAESEGPHGFAKRVALKRILPQLARDPRFVAMFCDEARICAMLEHPNIVKVIDFGESDGELFMAMEYVDGVSVARLLRAVSARGERFPLGAVLYIAHEILRALTHAHEAVDDYGRPLNIVHRDVSPGNVLIGREGEIKLTDFGIVRSAFVDRRTHPGELKGKLGYMSPEQVMGEELDPRSDLFTAAIIIAELCLVRPLFPGQNELEILTRTHRADLEVLDRFGTDLPNSLQQALRRALSSAATDRFQSAREFLAAVRSVAKSESIALNADQLAPWVFTLGVLRPRSGARDLSVQVASGQSGSRHVAPETTAPGTSGARPRAAEPLEADEQRTAVGGIYLIHGPGASEATSTSLYQLVERMVTGRVGTSLPISRDGVHFAPLETFPEFARITRSPAYHFADGSLAEWTSAVPRWELPGVWFHAALERLGGVLRVDTAGRARRLFLVNGRPRLVQSTDPNELLGNRLVARGVLDPSQLERALFLACERSQALGQILLDEALLSVEQLGFLLRQQLEAKLVNLGGVGDSVVSYVPGVYPGEVGIDWQRSQLSWVTQLTLASFSNDEVRVFLDPCLQARLYPGPRSVPPSELGLSDPMRRALLFASGGETLTHLIHSLHGERIAQQRETLFAVYLGLSAGLLSCEAFRGPFSPTR